jgi:hypothetical protein
MATFALACGHPRQVPGQEDVFVNKRLCAKSRLSIHLYLLNSRQINYKDLSITPLANELRTILCTMMYSSPHPS